MPLFEYLETPSFTRMLAEYLDDEEYVQLQRTLNDRPAAGVVVPGSGGVYASFDGDFPGAGNAAGFGCSTMLCMPTSRPMFSTN